MEWVRISFDGGDLVLARLTRRRPRVQVWTAIGPPVDGVYPTASRIEGIGWLGGLLLRLALQVRFGHGTRSLRQDKALLVHIGMPRERIQSGQMQLLLPFEHAFQPPFLHFQGGRVTVHLQPRKAAVTQKDLSKVPGLDAQVVNRFDASPWDGLVPEIPARKPLLGLRHPPKAGT